MLGAMTAWRTHPKGLSLNLKDGREILKLVHPLHHLPVVHASVTERATLTPGKVANLHSTYIQQINELNSLLESYY